MLLLDADAVRAALPMRDAVAAVRAVLRADAEGTTYQPLRSVLEPPGLPGSLLLKPAAVSGGQHGGVGVKLLTLFPENTDAPVIQGFVALFDPEDGAPLAILDGAVVTEIRTGAASAVATDVLARDDAGDLAIIGAGVQARAHLAAMAEVRRLRRVRVWNRTREHAEEFSRWAAGIGYEVEVCDSGRAAVEGSDLVCTVTSSPDPVLAGPWLAPGCHVNAVGAYRPDTRELDTEVVTRAAAIVVDKRASALSEAGALLIPMEEGALPRDLDPAELGELLTGARPLVRERDDITVFCSQGLAIEDIAAASEAVATARREGLGTDVPL